MSVSREEFAAYVDSFKNEIGRLRAEYQNDITRIERSFEDKLDSLRKWSDDHTKTNRKIIIGFGVVISGIGGALLERLHAITDVEARLEERIIHLESLLCAVEAIPC